MIPTNNHTQNANHSSPLSSPPRSSTDNNSPFIVFELGKNTLGIPSVEILEVLFPPQAVSRIPGNPSLIKGIINHRGTVFPIIKIKALLGMEENPETNFFHPSPYPQNRLIILQPTQLKEGELRMAFYVDNLLGSFQASRITAKKPDHPFLTGEIFPILTHRGESKIIEILNLDFLKKALVEKISGEKPPPKPQNSG